MCREGVCQTAPALAKVYHLLSCDIHARANAGQPAGSRKLCLAGGVAMNCVANAKLLSEGIVDEIFVPPCASDAGVALGAVWLALLKSGSQLHRQVLQTALPGPACRESEIDSALRVVSCRPSVLRTLRQRRALDALVCGNRVVVKKPAHSPSTADGSCPK